MTDHEHLPDIQSLPDYRNIPLDRVGVRNLRWPVTVQDRARGNQITVATVNMFVNLPHHFRGAHMSRFVEVLNEYRHAVWIDRIGEILHKIRELLQAEEAHMEMEFEYFIEKQAPVTHLSSPMAYTCRFLASQAREEDFILGVTVPVMTLCPCSKEIAAFGAHNQRCSVTVQVRYTGMVWIEDLVDLVEQSSSGGLYTILKRPDEKYVTEYAYNNPMFVEDVVRETAMRLDALEQVTWYLVEAESQESIHNHNAYARVEKHKHSPA